MLGQPGGQPGGQPFKVIKILQLQKYDRKFTKSQNCFIMLSHISGKLRLRVYRWMKYYVYFSLFLLGLISYIPVTKRST